VESHLHRPLNHGREHLHEHLVTNVHVYGVARQLVHEVWITEERDADIVLDLERGVVRVDLVVDV